MKTETLFIGKANKFVIHKYNLNGLYQAIKKKVTSHKLHKKNVTSTIRGTRFVLMETGHGSAI